MANIEETKKIIDEVQIMLDKIALLNYKRHNSKDLLDNISIIQEQLDNQININLPIYYEETEKEVKVKFWIHYNELDEYNINELVIFKDLKRLSIDMKYGNIHFYEEYDMRRDPIICNTINKENYYSISTQSR